MSAPDDKRKRAQIVAVSAGTGIAWVNCECGEVVAVQGHDPHIWRGDCQKCGRAFVGGIEVYVVDLDEIKSP